VRARHPDVEAVSCVTASHSATRCTATRTPRGARTRWVTCPTCATRSGSTTSCASSSNECRDESAVAAAGGHRRPRGCQRALRGVRGRGDDAAADPTVGILAASEEAQELTPPSRDQFEAQCRKIDVPTLVIHGNRDVCQHVDKGRAFAELTDAELIVIPGGGHLPLVRDPVHVNRAITDFVDRTCGAPMNSHVWTRGSSRGRKILYVSSPIGLGHVRRDLAIVDELRQLQPDIQIEWLAQDPVTAVLRTEGEVVHPASRWLASESGHFASEACGHDLHCFQALRNMDEILTGALRVVQECESPLGLRCDAGRERVAGVSCELGEAVAFGSAEAPAHGGRCGWLESA
jgi:hypothetical protein